jgi:hypothetical protein
MRRLALLAVLLTTIAAGGSWAQDAKDLTRVKLPDDKEAALKELKAWLM